MRERGGEREREREREIDRRTIRDTQEKGAKRKYDARETGNAGETFSLLMSARVGGAGR